MESKFSAVVIGKQVALEAKNAEETPTTVTGRKIMAEVFEEVSTGLWFRVDDPDCVVLTW